jgi:hypothetical protein
MFTVRVPPLRLCRVQVRRDLRPLAAARLTEAAALLRARYSAFSDAKPQQPQNQQPTPDAAAQLVAAVGAGEAAGQGALLATAATLRDGLGPVLCDTLDCPHFKVCGDDASQVLCSSMGPGSQGAAQGWRRPRACRTGACPKRSRLL